MSDAEAGGGMRTAHGGGAVSIDVEERLTELANLDADWDGGMFCQHSDPDLPHELPPSGPVREPTLAHVRALIAAVGYPPHSIMPISADQETGALAMVEWRGARDYISIEVGSDGPYGWLLIVDANDKTIRRFYESNHVVDAAEVICYAKTVCGEGPGL